MTSEIVQDGFAIVEGVLSAAEIEGLIERASTFSRHGRGGARNLPDVPAIRELAASATVRALVEPVLGSACFAVRALYFDKTPEANWKVPWHQDLMIAVRERVDGAPGYSAWSVKAGVPHVEPPIDVLEQMLAVRIHLDDCGADSGPLRVIPGSHRRGRLSGDEKPEDGSAVECCVAHGGVILMRPLLVHASSAARLPAHRRVIHIEYAACEVPNGVAWRDRA